MNRGRQNRGGGGGRWMTILAMGGGRLGRGKSGGSWRGCAAREGDDRWVEELEKKM